MKKITKEELQEQINNLQKQLDNFKEPSKFKKGTWYKFIQHSTCIVNYQESGRGYGTSIYGAWGDAVIMNNDGRESSSKWVEATDKEVEAMLIKEAKKRGFKEGVRFKSAMYSSLFTLKKGIYYKSMENCIYNGNGYGTIFKDGKWATIIEDSKPKINGYEMEVDGNEISFGCAKFHKTWLTTLYTSITKKNNQTDSFEDCNRKIKGVVLDSGYTLSLVDLEATVNYLKNE